MMDQTERTRVLSDLVKINSVNGNELEVANYLRRLFEQHGLTADVQPFGEQRANLIVEVGATWTRSPWAMKRSGTTPP